MKKSIITGVALLALSSAFGQGMSLGFKTGFNFPMAGHEMGSYREITSVNGTDTKDDEKVIYGTNGQGIPLTLDFRYMFNEHVGIQVDATYLLGMKKLMDYEKRDITAGPATYYSESTTKVSTQQFRLAPQLVIKADKLYARSGIVLPLFGSTTGYFVNENNLPISGSNPANKTEVNQKLTGKFSVGFIGAIGYEMNLSDKLGLFGEVEYMGLSIKRKQAEFTKYMSGSVDVLATMTDDQKITEYDDEINHLDANPKALGEKGFYNTLGVQIGVRLKF